MKKITSFILSIMMLLSVCIPTIAYDTADEVFNEENMLYAILEKVKSTIDIPKELTEFDYYLNTRYEETRWNLYWNTEDYSKSIEITADGNGNIISYYSYAGNSSGAPKVTKEEAKANALNFITKVAADVIPSITLTSSNVSGSDYRFVFTRTENGIEYHANKVTVSVNYITGDIANFNISWDRFLEFPSKEKIVSFEDVKDIWLEKSDMNLVWDLVYEYDEETYQRIGAKAYLVWKNISSYPNIDAHTGEFVEDYVIWDKNTDSEDSSEAVTPSAPSGDSSANDVYISPEEFEKIDEHSKYLTVDAADKALRAFGELSIDSTFEISYSQLSRGVNGAYWALTYKGNVTQYDYNVPTITATINALTGELISYNAYNNHNESEITAEFVIDKEQSENLAQEFIAKVLPDYAEKLELSSSSDVTYGYYEENGKEYKYIQVPYGTGYQYSRLHDGVTLEDNRANITVDQTLGKITNFSYNLTENIEFVDKEAVLDKEAACEAYIDFADIGLYYNAYTVYLYDVEASSVSTKTTTPMSPDTVVLPSYPSGDMDTKTKIGLDYVFSNSANGISAVTGKAVDYECRPIEKQAEKEEIFYSDIQGHWAQRVIRLLYDTEILIKGDSFAPDSYITQKEFLAMLSNAAYGYGRYTDIEKISFDFNSILNYFISRQIILDEEMDDDSGVTRQTAVKFMIRALGYGDIAKYHSIFKCDYIDADQIEEENIGYVALAQAMGIANGSDGYFNPAKLLTKAEAAMLIYNYMNRK